MSMARLWQAVEPFLWPALMTAIAIFGVSRFSSTPPTPCTCPPVVTSEPPRPCLGGVYYTHPDGSALCVLLGGGWTARAWPRTVERIAEVD